MSAWRSQISRSHRCAWWVIHTRSHAVRSCRGGCRGSGSERRVRPRPKSSWAGGCDAADWRSSSSSLRKKVWNNVKPWTSRESHPDVTCGDACPTAQERMNELEAKLENVLSTVDRVFKVEILKMPPSLQNTLIGDLISGDPQQPPPKTHKIVVFVCFCLTRIGLCHFRGRNLCQWSVHRHEGRWLRQILVSAAL